MRRAALALAFLCLTTAPAWGECKVHRGERVVLYSTTDDPSVLAWDSRTRLREYHAASFDVARAMLPHALLLGPGTHATVVTCTPNYVESPLFTAPEDAIGVVMSTGSQRGVTRWVLSSDVRLVNR